MVDYRVLVADASLGQHLVELPLDGLTFSRVLNGCGSLSGTIGIYHPAATEHNLGLNANESDRELTVFRDDVPVWNGPITGIDGTVGGGSLSITAREASWYLSKRVLEEDRTYASEDVFDIVRDLESYMETKTSDGNDGLTLGDDIIAALPRYFVTAGSAGATADASFSGAARHTIQECFDFLAADPETGFDWRMDYQTGSTRQSVRRTLTLGYPSLGSDLDTLLTERVLFDWGRTVDWERAATRVHVVGSGYTKTLQNTGAVSNGILLTETVADLTDTSDHSQVNAYARDLRRVAQPPVHVLTASYVPGSALPFGFCELGDRIPFEVTSPEVLSITANRRRVVEIGVTPGQGDAPELVALTMNLPLDMLGA